jgi:hypothetical protein
MNVYALIVKLICLGILAITVAVSLAWTFKNPAVDSQLALLTSLSSLAMYISAELGANRE